MKLSGNVPYYERNSWEKSGVDDVIIQVMTHYTGDGVITKFSPTADQSKSTLY